MAAALLIDVGNTRLKWAEGTPQGRIRVQGDIATKEATARWAAGLAKKYIRHRVIIASVVPTITARLRRAFGRHALFVTAETSGLAFVYPHPAELGADRLAAAAAVRGPAIIIACGTATAVSVIDARGRFCGGVIAPGLATQLASLLGATAQLPDVLLKLRPRALARSTTEAIQAGVVLNFQGGVREIVTQQTREMKIKPRVIVTGGYSSFLKGTIVPMEVRPLLVFEGLHIIGQRLPSSAV